MGEWKRLQNNTNVQLNGSLRKKQGHYNNKQKHLTSKNLKPIFTAELDSLPLDWSFQPDNYHSDCIEIRIEPLIGYTDRYIVAEFLRPIFKTSL